jgi:hypothetical protein
MKLINDPDICFAFGFNENVSERERVRILSESIRNIKKKLRRVIEIRPGGEPLLDRIGIRKLKSWKTTKNHVPKPERILDAFKTSEWQEKLLESTTDPVDRALLDIYFTCRKKEKDGITPKRLNQAEIALELKKIGIDLTQTAVSRRLQRIKTGGKLQPNLIDESEK